MKKIAIDCISLLSPKTGIGRYTYENAKRLIEYKEYEWRLYYGFFSKKLYGKENGITRVKSLMTRRSFLKKAAKKSIVLYTKYLYNQNFDLYWQPNYIPDPVVKSKKCVVSVHDFSFILNPSWHPKERVEFFDKYFFKNIKRADRIITGSNYSKKEVEKFTGFEKDRIEVIYHGVDHKVYKEYPKEILEGFKKKLSLPDKFFLFVGSVEPRKNLSYLIKAYLELPKFIKNEYKLLIIGFEGWENKDIKKMMEKERDNIFYMGFLSDIKLAFIYNLASLFIYPSLYEGFGLPPLEAMACKTPVITSSVSSLPEVCKDGALYIDPLDESDLIDKILKFVDDEKLQYDLIEKGYNRSKLFSWDKASKKHLEVFEKELKEE